jgi:hypothetical protein
LYQFDQGWILRWIEAYESDLRRIPPKCLRITLSWLQEDLAGLGQRVRFLSQFHADYLGHQNQKVQAEFRALAEANPQWLPLHLLELEI